MAHDDSNIDKKYVKRFLGSIIYSFVIRTIIHIDVRRLYYNMQRPTAVVVARLLLN